MMTLQADRAGVRDQGRAGEVPHGQTAGSGRECPDLELQEKGISRLDRKARSRLDRQDCGDGPVLARPLQASFALARPDRRIEEEGRGALRANLDAMDEPLLFTGLKMRA